MSNAIHGLWIGRHLSRLEKLALLSFVRHGHEFNLWVYDELDEPVPTGVTLRDAATVLPRDRIFLKAETDPSAGVGRKSYGPFSDLFRYKLLHDHGGIWADMDVTCLKPFDFAAPYVFRAHKIGVIGNLLKAPRNCPLMRMTFEQAERVADENVPWLALNRILRNHVYLLQLSNFIRKDIINEGSLSDTIIDYASSGYKTPPPSWYGIHWGNEFWGTRTSNHTSDQRGEFATKDQPAEGSFLYELYRSYGLIDPRGKDSVSRVSLPSTRKEGLASLAANEPVPTKPARRSVNMLVSTLARGGAERIVIDIAETLARDPDIDVFIYVKNKATTSHEVKLRPNLFVAYLSVTLVELAEALVSRGNPLIFTHLIVPRDLQTLWHAGLLTIPVVHNSKQGWGPAPTEYDHPNVPLVVACADFVKEELKQAGGKAPVVTIRHEIRVSPSAEDLKSGRAKIRSQWGIADDTLVIGMVGQFKTQKAYTRAVRILAAMSEFSTAKLMIVGGWDHKYGAGRTTFEATMRLAVDLGVSADMILIGEVASPIPYLAAFDVFLNTSIFEGLSVSLMEAIACGCPLVLADVGGAAEIAPPEAVLIRDGTDIEAYCIGILQAVSRDVRRLPGSKPDPDLVAQIWLGLGKVASKLTKPAYPRANGTLVIIDGLHIGGPASSLIRLLGSTKRQARVGVAALRGISVPEFADSVRDAEAKLFKLPAGVAVSRTANNLLDILIEHDFGSVCFWNAQPEIKLLLTKLLESSQIKVIDVSPGPMLYDELDATTEFQRRIAFTAKQYFGRLDRFVALHKSGLPASCRPPRTSVIPLGVPLPPRFIPLPPAQLLPPERVDLTLAIGTVTRLVPYKHVELLLEAMAILARDLPGASLTVVGGPDATSTGYALQLQRKIEELGLQNIFFVGPYLDVNRFLARWRVFVLSGERQGCPNASLEAMAMGLPVVAFGSGGLREQVVNGKTGYLVKTPRDMASRLRLILSDDVRRKRMGSEARKRAREKFGLKESADAFARVIDI